ncbi:hypothetical protein C8F04DRAFT_1176384 [Mycena alexandri]|uniref:RING-type domain-containing protein n=1 Tax=Mycena alexandri TaxID=1745969 RepID=A0AAD6TD99_9AGAR|nr:hypothetical protein C8F04DRAFT_1176384 [Mycena alexandri]
MSQTPDNFRRPSGSSKKFAAQTPEERSRTRALLAQSGRRAPIPKALTRVRVHNPRQHQQSQAQAGYREPRTTALTREDLYDEGRLPAALAFSRPSQRCSLCAAVKCHPVSYLCGHSHCYACIRLWLDRDWRCPVSTCRALITREPHRHFAEEQALAEAFPNWVDATSVAYSWDGLTFPKAAEHDFASGDESS